MLSFENEHDSISYDQYYMSTVKIKDYYVLKDSKSFFQKIFEIGRNNYNNYKTGHLLDNSYF